MPKTLAKRKKETGKLTDEAESRKVCLARSAKLAKSTEVPLVVTPEAALYARVLTALLKVTSTPLPFFNTIIKIFLVHLPPSCWQ